MFNRFFRGASAVFVLLLIMAACSSGPSAGGSGGDDRNADPQANMIVHNESGEEIALYIDRAYKKTIPAGARFSINVEGTSASGTRISIHSYSRSKVRDLSVFPPEENANLAITFVARPPSPAEQLTPIVIPYRTQEEIAQGIDQVLVRFSYNDMPKLNSTIVIFTGSENVRKELVAMINGDSRLVPMSPGPQRFSVQYEVGGRSLQRKTYPETVDQFNNDRKFQFVVYADRPEQPFTIPMIHEVFQLSYVNVNPATVGTLRVKNETNQIISVLTAKDFGSDLPIAGNNSSVEPDRRRDFPINTGTYLLRAVDAFNERNSIADVDGVLIEPGMIYYWYIRNRGNELNVGPNMAVSQRIKDYFQTWIIDSTAEAKINLKIASTSDEVRPNTYSLGITDRNGRLTLQTIDIESLIRGLTTDNARRVVLTLIYEKDGYLPASQSISAYSLLMVGAEFKPERLLLEREQTPDGDAEFIIGEPLPFR